MMRLRIRVRDEKLMQRRLRLYQDDLRNAKFKKEYILMRLRLLIHMDNAAPQRCFLNTDLMINMYVTVYCML
jgi:hypothetical protein